MLSHKAKSSLTCWIRFSHLWGTKWLKMSRFLKLRLLCTDLCFIDCDYATKFYLEPSFIATSILGAIQIIRAINFETPSLYAALWAPADFFSGGGQNFPRGAGRAKTYSLPKNTKKRNYFSRKSQKHTKLDG